MSTEDDFCDVFSSFPCPSCGTKFTREEIKVVRDEDDGLVVLQFRCSKCQKSFGVAFLGLTSAEIKKGRKNEAAPITYDDVLNAHGCIENLEENWKKFVAKNNPD